MLVDFTVENWMSFREPASFSLVASGEKQHSNRLAIIRKYKTRILPVAAIYGGNASGKTNFFKALSFAKNFVVKGVQADNRIPVEPFRLAALCAEQPSRFTFELLIADQMFEFSFSVTPRRVISESLIQVNSTSEKTLYQRDEDQLVLHPSLDDDKFLHFAFRGTETNQLYLTNAVSQKVDQFRPVYNWFKNTLELIAPDSRFGPFEEFFDEESPLNSVMNDLLPQLDTGIARLGGENIQLGDVTLPESVKKKLEAEVQEGESIRVRSEPNNERFIVSRKDGALAVKKLVSYHTDDQGEAIEFDLGRESDGSQRIIDLLPAFLELSTVTNQKVYVIDELDRSLHTLITRQLLESYLNNCSHSNRSQLLFTTHDVFVMDQSLLRRDEMWIAERNTSGESTLIAFSEYKDVRYDKDIRKSYLQGRLGGIPRISSGSNFLSCATGEGRVGCNEQ